MKEMITCRMKAYIQPFERKLAIAELTSLTNSIPSLVGKRKKTSEKVDYLVESKLSLSNLADRLAYWESVGQSKPLFTEQVLREATVNLVRNGVELKEIEFLVNTNIEAAIPNRRCLRYGPHGLHEYRGKFFPQLVTSLINIAGVPAGGIIADPMSGSGTALVEAVLGGYHGLGIDMNPLSVFMAKIKCSVLSAEPNDLLHAYEKATNQLSNYSPKRGKLKYVSSLPQTDQDYLANWFSEKVIKDLDCISEIIDDQSNPVVKDLFRLSLSNILRKVSWQKGTDLRVRKEIRPDSELDPINEFKEEIRKSVKTVVSLLYQLQRDRLGSFDLTEGSARNIQEHWAQWGNKVDVIITSPPYATALPYLDTDRLSLIYLGLLGRKDHRSKDVEMIGNREVTENVRQIYWQDFKDKKSLLPPSVTKLIKEIDALNSTITVGFRRKNLPALLGKYFLDMREVMTGMLEVLKPGACAYIVIGDNHTIAGNKKVDITTARFLEDIGLMVGFEAGEHVSMEMLVSRDIFKNNAVASEEILCLRRPKESA